MSARHLFGQFFGALRGDVADPALDAAVARAVEFVEPRLKLLGAYPGRYRKAVARGLAHARELAARVPGPVDLDQETFNRDPAVHAMFVSLDEVKAGMCVSQAMREYIRDNPAVGEVYGLLGMRRWEKNVLGMEMDGEVLRREVPQVVVYFNSHTMGSPAPTEAAAREAMAWNFFEALLKEVRARVDARYAKKVDLEHERDELLARLRLPSLSDRLGLERRHGELIKELQAVNAGLELRAYGEDFDAVLLDPAKSIRLEEATMRLDGMGVKRAPGHPTSANELTFTDLVGYDRRRWTVVMVHCANIGDGSISGRLENACRILSI